MKKITEQSLVEMSRNLKTRLNKVSEANAFTSSPARYLYNKAAGMLGADDEYIQYNDPNDTDGATIPASQIPWQLMKLAGYRGQNAQKQNGHWYTSPGNNIINNPQAIVFFEKQAMKNSGNTKPFVDPEQVTLNAPVGNPATYDVDSMSTNTGVNAHPVVNNNMPAEGTRSKSKSGKDIIFLDGRWKYAKQ